MKPIRLIVSDLDGTLLSDNHRLTPQVRDTVKEFINQGGMFTFATGRPYLTVKPIADELGLELPFICCNGSILAAREAMLKVEYLDIAPLLELIEHADKQGVSALVFRHDQIDAIRRTEAIQRFETKENIQVGIAGSVEDLPQQDIHKLLLVGDMEVITPLWEQFNVQPDKFAAFQSEHDFLEIIPGGQSKGTAMLQLMEELQVSKAEVLAIGNEMNDLDMLQLAGVGVAVANSNEKLKPFADYVSENGFGDGVVEAIRKFTTSRLLKKS